MRKTAKQKRIEHLESCLELTSIVEELSAKLPRQQRDTEIRLMISVYDDSVEAAACEAVARKNHVDRAGDP